jgi:MFS family permease
VTFAASINSSLQLAVEPAMRGRVMALYSVVFLGSTPIGAPLVGWLAEIGGPRSGLVLGAVAALITGLVARAAYARGGVRTEEPAVAHGHRGSGRPVVAG